MRHKFVTRAWGRSEKTDPDAPVVTCWIETDYEQHVAETPEGRAIALAAMQQAIVSYQAEMRSTHVHFKKKHPKAKNATLNNAQWIAQWQNTTFKAKAIDLAVGRGRISAAELEKLKAAKRVYQDSEPLVGVRAAITIARNVYPAFSIYELEEYGSKITSVIETALERKVDPQEYLLDCGLSEHAASAAIEKYESAEEQAARVKAETKREVAATHAERKRQRNAK